MALEFNKIMRLKVYTGEDVIVGEEPLFKTIVNEARRLKLAGATVVKGIGGYASETRGMTRKAVTLFTGVSDLPVIIEMIDTQENIEKILPFLEKHADHALVIIEESTYMVTDYMRKMKLKKG